MDSMVLESSFAKAPTARRLSLGPLAGLWRGARRPDTSIATAQPSGLVAAALGPPRTSWTWRASAMSDAECNAHTHCCERCGGRWLEFRTMLRGCPFCRPRPRFEDD